MELYPISQVSKKYGISKQMLRYYEQVGLIKSIRNDENEYRFYDEEVIKKLSSIIFLRKLRISVKQIKEILNNKNALTTVEIFERNIRELDEEITSLSTIKTILTRFAEELRAKADMVLPPDLFNNTDTLSIVDSISFSKNYINKSPTKLEAKEKVSMEDLNKANETLEKLEEKKNSETVGPVETPTKTNQGKLERFEIVKFGPYKFVGKSIYIGNKKGLEEFNVFDYMWERRDWIFNELDERKEYNSDEPYNAALVSWDRYDDKNQLLGYTVGRFMKTDTPMLEGVDAPEALDYIDIPETYIAKAWWRADNADGQRGGTQNSGKWFAYNDALVQEEIERTGVYKAAPWMFMAEVHPIIHDDSRMPLIGTYVPCELK